MIAERKEKDRIRKEITRALYIKIFGSTRLLKGPEKRKYNSKRRKTRNMVNV